MLVVKKIILVSHDVEKTGSYLISSKIMSVGFCIGDDEGTILETRKFNIAVIWPTIENNTVVHYGDFEPRCWNEFWSKQPKFIQDACMIKPTAVAPDIAWVGVSNFINSLEKNYPEKEYSIKFLSDNASFDTAAIDYALEIYASRYPMRYSTTGKYRSVIAADDMLTMLPKVELIGALSRINSKVIHDHDPVNDAHHIYMQYIEAKKYKERVQFAENALV